MLKEIEIVDKIQKLTERILRETGFIQVLETNKSLERKYSDNQSLHTDLSMKVRTKSGKMMNLVFEVKAAGQPRYVRSAVNQLQELMNVEKNIYGVIAAGFLSEESRDICQKEGFGYVDAAGNCLFHFNGVYIHIEGKPNLYPSTRPLKSIFSPKSTRLLRVILCNPKLDWYVKELAKEAKISLGHASNLKNRLLEYEFIETTERGKLRLREPEKLLLKWSENYSYSSNRVHYFYTLEDPAKFEDRLINYLEKTGINYAFTLTSGAARVAPYLRYKKVFAYVVTNLQAIFSELELKKVSSGANVIFLEPYDEGVFYGLQEIDNTKIVSNIQLYLDLKNFKERGDEAAEFILKEHIRKSW